MRKILLILICIFLGSTYAYTIDITTHYLGTGATYWNLPDTGQTISYTDTFGEDHDYQPAASQPSYTDNGDTITDNRTGLMWVKDDTSAGCNYGNTLTWEQALTFCEGLDYAGYTDWRLPNAKEMVTIVDYTKDAGPLINTTYFLNAVIEQMWSSTTYVLTTTNAWGMRFSNGHFEMYIKANANSQVRPVRGGP